MIDQVRTVASTIAPASWTQTLIWAAKVGVSTFLGLVGAEQLLDIDLGPETSAALAAGVAALNVVINRALVWAAAP